MLCQPQREEPHDRRKLRLFAPCCPPDLPPAAARWPGLAKYNFTGGNNDADEVPVEGLIAAANASLKREGRNLATYNLAHGPHGYRPLREFLVAKLKRDAGIACTADDILLALRLARRRSIWSTARC